jgi:undecaprenyl diphosphate synthase
MQLHLGIIPDGNRRWSRENNQSIDALLDKINLIFIRSLMEENKYPESFSQIGSITMYVLSKDNLIKRNDSTLNMIRNGLHIVNSKMIFLQTAKVQFIGELQLLPDDIRALCHEIESKSNPLGTFVLTVGIAYDPLLDTRRVILNDSSRPKQTNIDLIIRTGGEKRSSGFFPLHTLYSEWFYLDKYFPDITLGDIGHCIDTFHKRNRRFGQ